MRNPVTSNVRKFRAQIRPTAKCSRVSQRRPVEAWGRAAKAICAGSVRLVIVATKLHLGLKKNNELHLEIYESGQGDVNILLPAMASRAPAGAAVSADFHTGEGDVKVLFPGELSLNLFEVWAFEF